MIRGFFGRLKQRNVIRVAGVYAVSGYAVFQIANALLPALNVPRWVLTLIASLFLLGFPVVVLLAYAFEWTPEGFRRTSGSRPPVPARVGWFDWSLLGATAALVVFAIFSLVIRPQFSDPPVATEAAVLPAKSIAVLPFASFSDVPETEYFADGLTEELINGLAQLPDLKVAGRTSSFYFKGRNEDLREVGRKLGVAHVLEGSVRRSGDNIRVTAQLIQVSDGFHLWSESFDSPMSDALTVQTRIARAVATVMQARLLAGPDPATGQARDPRAYQLELVARSRLRKQELDELEMSRSLYKELMALEPANPGPYIGFAEATMALAQNHLALDFDAARQESETAIQRALTLAPRSSEAWRVRGFIHRIKAIRSGERGSNDDALAAFQRAVDLDPRNADALAMLAAQQISAGQTEQAAAVLRRSLEIDPLSRLGQQMLGVVLQDQGKLGEARQQYESLVSLYPDFTNARVLLAELQMSQGQLDAAVRTLNHPDLIRDDPLAGFVLANCYANLGMDAEADAVLEGIREPPPAAAAAQAALLLRAGKRQELLEFARSQFALTSDPIWLSVTVLHAVQTNDAVLAAAAVKDIAAEPQADEGVLEGSSLLDSVLMAEALRLAGRTDQSRRIHERILARFATAPGEYVSNEVLWIRTLSLAALGRTDAAFADLARAVDQGFRKLIDLDYFMRPEDYPFLDRLTADPRYRPLADRVEADSRRMREALR